MRNCAKNVLVALGCVLGLAACSAPPSDNADFSARSAEESAVLFTGVVARVEPVAEQYCRDTTQRLNCDFEILVLDDASAPANAFQTLNRAGRPQIVFTLALIADARNGDELAFVLGHEAAHHIAGHLPQTRSNARAGGLILGGLIGLSGGDPASVELALQLGAELGARAYSKDFELQADRLGTIIAARAGYDPVRGAAFFSRIPDPGDRFLGTHPPNAERQQVVRETAAGL